MGASKKVPPPIDKPNRRTVEMLLRELSRFDDQDSPLYEVYRAADQEAGELEEKLLNNRRLNALKKKRDAAHSRYWDERNQVRDVANKIRRDYLAKGVTPSVLRALNALLAKLKRTK